MKSFPYILLAALIAFWASYAVTNQWATAAPTSDGRLVVGQRYGFVYSCLAQIGCYGEVVMVRAVGDDGWVEVMGADGQPWTINLANVVSFQALDEHQVSR